MPKINTINATIILCLGFVIGGILISCLDDSYDYSRTGAMCFGALLSTFNLHVNRLVKNA